MTLAATQGMQGGDIVGPGPVIVKVVMTVGTRSGTGQFSGTPQDIVLGGTAVLGIIDTMVMAVEVRTMAVNTGATRTAIGASFQRTIVRNRQVMTGSALQSTVNLVICSNYIGSINRIRGIYVGGIAACYTVMAIST